MTSSVNSNAVLCVKGEIHNVLTVLRLNSRWASRERFSREVPLQAESPLSRAFKSLHSYLEEVDDLANVDTVRYLLPFLAVVESPATTGPMTGVALSSLHKFLLYGFIRKDCPRVKEAITLVAQAISRCHFEETDPDSDEVVLMKLLELSALCLRCEVGDLLNDESCWNVFLACYNLYHVTTDARSSGLLRDTAGNTLAHVVLMLFSCARVSRARSLASASAAASAAAVAAAASDGNATDGTAAELGINRQSTHPVGNNSSHADGSGTKLSAGELAGTGNGGGAMAAATVKPPKLASPQDETEEEPWPSVDGDGYAAGGSSGESGDRFEAALGDDRAALEGLSGSSHGERKGMSGRNGGKATVAELSGGGRRGQGGREEVGGAVEEVEENGVLVNVMRFLSRLSDPRSNGSAECVLGLSLINIALEAGGADLGRIPALVRVMGGDLCKHLLQNSQTGDLDVLSLTLRVVFNLFNSIKDHLKVQLEVFLTSVHLRVLEGANNGPEQQELALESLLEFTREPALMLDVYINYDCDVQCTNLFETICHSLSSHAMPRDGMEVNALNRLALEGVLAVIESISRRCQALPPSNPRAGSAPQWSSTPFSTPLPPSSGASMTNGDPGSSSPTPAAPTSGLGNHPTFPNLNPPSTTSTSMPTFADPHHGTDPGTDPGTGVDRTGSVPEKKGSNSSNGKRGSSYVSMASDSDSDQDSVGSFAYAYGRSSTGSAGVSGVNFAGAAYGGDDDRVSKGRTGSEGDAALRGGRGRAGGAGGAGDDELEWLERARARTAEVLQERKKMKRRLGLAAERFNTGSKGWLEYAQELALIPTPATPAATAMFLKRTVMLDKSMLGEYLSRGPPDKYPFNAKVLEEYVKLFDMREKTFVEALRAFLKEFRLPGEAQCIDRLMEAFAGQQYEQGLGSGRHPFVSADAAFTMAFSAIMLNTDLHNPQIPDSRRMTLDDFVRNNRQINGGEDLPREFLEEVFTSIRDIEIQVHRDHVSMAADGLGIDYTQHWDGILNRSNSVASASFTPSRAARKHLFPAGVHERDMLVSFTGPASDALRAVFLRTKDDLLVLGCLRGFRSHARACVYLGLLAPFDAALVFCFHRGLEYASAAAEGAAGPPLPEVLKNPGLPDVTDMAACAPFASGCVVHRDLLALKCGLELARAYAHCVSSAWGPLLECVFALADLQALPPSLTDVDDFGDAQGNPLPPSVFARRCRDRARSGQNALLSQSGGARAVAAAAAAGGGSGGGGLWGSLSGVLFMRAGEAGGAGGRGGGAAAEAAIGALAEVVRIVQLENLFQQTKDLPLKVVENLLSALLRSRDPAAPRRSSSSSTATAAGLVRSVTGDSSDGGGGNSTGSGGGGNNAGSGGGGSGSGGNDADPTTVSSAAAASFEAHAVLALELSSRVVLANRHRVARLWPSLHLFLARVLGGEGAVTMTRMPFLVERAMVTVLRACIHMLDREDMGALLLKSLRLLLSLPPDVVLPLSNRLASGLLILIQANASALSLPSTLPQWDVIGTLMVKAVVGDGGRGFVLEALAFVVKRGLGLLGRHNVVMVHRLLSGLAEGRFDEGSQDFAWSSQACSALEAMVFTVFEGLLVDSEVSFPQQGQRQQQPSPPPPPDAFAAQGTTFADAAAEGVNEVGLDAAAGPGSPPGMSSPQEGVTDGEAALSGGAGAGVERELPQGLSRDEAEGLWLSTLRILGGLTSSAYPRTAKGAAESLERVALQLHGIRPDTWGRAFSEVLLRLPVPFLPAGSRASGSYSSGENSPQGTTNEEVCLRCCNLLSHAFLHHLQALASLTAFGQLWLESIRLLSQNLDGARSRSTSNATDGEVGDDVSFTRGGGIATESCQQIVTNMVMVVAHMGLLGGPMAVGDTGSGDASRGSDGGGQSTGEHERADEGSGDVIDPQSLLHLTRQIIEPVCPGLRPLLRGLAGEDLTPPPPSPPSGSPAVAGEESGLLQSTQPNSIPHNPPPPPPPPPRSAAAAEVAVFESDNGGDRGDGDTTRGHNADQVNRAGVRSAPFPEAEDDRFGGEEDGRRDLPPPVVPEAAAAPEAGAGHVIEKRRGETVPAESALTTAELFDRPRPVGTLGQPQVYGGQPQGYGGQPQIV